MEAVYSQRKGLHAFAITLFIIALVAMNTGTILYAQQGTSREIPQYLFNKFADGIVKKKNGEMVVTPLNYNVVTEEMVFINDDKFLALGALETIDTVYLNKMVFVPFGKVFYEAAVIAPVTLFVQFNATVSTSGEQVGYGGTSQTSRVTTVSSLGNEGAYYRMDLPDNLKINRTITFWVRKNGEMSRFINERAFLKIFPEKKKELSGYISDNKIDFKAYDDIVELIQHVNELY